MASINYSVKTQNYTHEGAKASKITALQELQRSVMSCFLWENSFYEDGVSHGERICDLCNRVNIKDIAEVAIYARTKMNLRHMPLWLAAILVNKKFTGIADLLNSIIQRPDEITEFVALYWKDRKKPLPNQVKKGLALAFKKFTAYQLAKYNNQSKAVKLRDVLFLIHAKPDNEEQALIWKKLCNNELESPDTWEVALSKGADKKETFERLMRENKLGAFAFIRNLRNMYQAGVFPPMITAYFDTLNFDKILPFRFITAAINAPQYTIGLEKAFLNHEWTQVGGRTVFLIDVSGSMNGNLSNKSEVTRMQAASALALIGINIFPNSEVCTFSEGLAKVKKVNNFSLIENIRISQNHGGTYLGMALQAIYHNDFDRLIIITDEQSADNVIIRPNILTYIINVGTYQNGIAYRQAVHIDGFSENVFKFILEYEASGKSYK